MTVGVWPQMGIRKFIVTTIGFLAIAPAYPQTLSSPTVRASPVQGHPGWVSIPQKNEKPDVWVCLRPDSIGPGPQGFIQVQRATCFTLGQFGYDGVVNAIDCGAWKRGDQQVTTLDYDSKKQSWETNPVSSRPPPDSYFGLLYEYTCSFSGSAPAATQTTLPQCDRLVQAIENCARRAPDGQRGAILAARDRLLDMIQSKNPFVSSLCENDLKNWSSCSGTASATSNKAKLADPVDWSNCGSPTFSVTGCTRIIEQSKQLTEEALAAAYNNRAIAYGALGEWHRAIADYDQAISLKQTITSLAGAYRNRGLAYVQLRQFDGAISDLNESIRLNPKDGRTYNVRGGAWRFKGDLNRALADYNQSIAIELDPQRKAEAYSGRGGTLREMGELDRAIADFDRAISLSPKLASAYLGRGLTRRAKSDMDRAIADYEQAIRLSPQLNGAYVGRGLAHESKGEIDRGMSRPMLN
jgi:tetratricopeptide (TPR) repeat protein